jgi:tetratricopeptide (TPR) repeat protein
LPYFSDLRRSLCVLGALCGESSFSPYNGLKIRQCDGKVYLAMRWQQAEFILKGIYLGLLVFLALVVPDWAELGVAAGFTLGGLALCLGIAAYRKLREGYRVRGRLLPFLLFLLLENPGLVYAGVLLGLALGTYTVRPEGQDSRVLLATVGGGAVLGYVLWLLRTTQAGRARLWLSLALGVVLTAGAIAAIYFDLASLSLEQQHMIGAVLLLGIPLFYLLTFASLVEESEVEVGAMCAALGVGLWLLGENSSPLVRSLWLSLPLLLYFTYSRYVLPGLRVFKHILRGISYASVDQFRPALASFSRALALDPRSSLAREHLWAVHRRLDFDQLANDEEMLALVSFELCLERAASLLLAPPRPEQLQEAHRLLDLVAKHRPDLQPRCDYWNAVALTHERHYDQAAASLENVIAARSSPADSPHRQAVLLDAWRFALLLHPEMRRRVGDPQLAQAGRRMEAIAAVERRLAVQADDADAWDLKRLLYSELTEAEYNQAAADGRAAPGFDHTYAHQLGMALIADAERWQRGAAYLRMAARGVPANAPTILVQVAKASEKAGDFRAAWQSYELARDAGRAAGPKNLAEEDRHTWFAVVKMLADSARADGKLDAAIDNYLLYTQYERAGIETYRHLASLYERRRDPWSALHATAQGLVYDSQDPDLLQRREKYYYSVTPEELSQRRESVAKWFDVDYCVDKARWLLDRHADELDLVDWASHLLDLAQVARPGSISIRVLRARVRRLRGELPEAVAMLEEIRTNRPERFPSGDEEEAWYLGCRLLGDLYLEEQPDKAIECLQEFRKSARSGADTLYKMGVAYERLGDLGRAVNCYKQVAAFDQHPLAPEAHDAILRLQTPSV